MSIAYHDYFSCQVKNQFHDKNVVKIDAKDEMQNNALF